MNSVERVKEICKERKIPISRLEKDLGFSNGYIGQLRKGTFPIDRLSKISKYLDLPISYLLGDTLNPDDKTRTHSAEAMNERDWQQEKENPLVNGDKELTEYLEMLKNRPECRMLFKVSKDATKEDVEQAVKIIEALRK